MPRLYAFAEAWESAPPLAETVASYLGIKPRGVASANPATGLKPALPQMLSDMPTIKVVQPL